MNGIKALEYHGHCSLAVDAYIHVLKRVVQSRRGDRRTQTDTDRQRQTKLMAGRQTSRQARRQAGRQAGKLAGRLAGKRIDSRLTGIQAG